MSPIKIRGLWRHPVTIEEAKATAVASEDTDWERFEQEAALFAKLEDEDRSMGHSDDCLVGKYPLSLGDIFHAYIAW
jgi:hypothetical protein